MALGEWLSLTNAHELSGALIDQELDRLGAEVELHAERSVPVSGAAAVARGSAESQWRAPLAAAGVSFVLFGWGALVPLLPFFWSSSRLACAVWSLSALFALGIATSFFNGRGALYSGVRQCCIGAAAAALTYSAGWLFGALR
jgi:VIT1/CCC1 family predicted Fe2+/Mn2+ transporter